MIYEKRGNDATKDNYYFCMTNFFFLVDTGEQDISSILRCCSAGRAHGQMAEQAHTELSASPPATCLLLAPVLKQEPVSVTPSLDLLHRHTEETSFFIHPKARHG